MSIKTTGAQWKRFYKDPAAWPDGAYHDDTVVSVDGVVSQDVDLGEVADNANLEVQCGYVIFPDGRDTDLAEYFSAWLKNQTTCCGTFEAPMDMLEAVKAAVIAAGGTITSN